MARMTSGCGGDGRLSGRRRLRPCSHWGRVGWIGSFLLLAAACSDQKDTPMDPGDTTPPSAVGDLRPAAVTDSAVTLAWTAPGDDGGSGTAAVYDLRFSRTEINDGNWSSAGGAAGEPAPAVGGTPQTLRVDGLADSTTYYFALRTFDEASNVSELSNLATATTLLTPSPYEEDDFVAIGGLIEDALSALGPVLAGLADLLDRSPVGLADGSAAGCPDFDWQVGEGVVSLTVDYGAGCAGVDGVTRSGSYNLNGSYRQSTGIDLIIEFDGYTVDDGSTVYSVEGEYGVRGSPDAMTLTVDGTVTAGGTTTRVVASITVTVKTGGGASSTTFVLTGAGSVETDGIEVAFSLAAILWPTSCYLPVDGIATVTIPEQYLDDLGLPGTSNLNATVDFAAPNPEDPACDGLVVVSIGRYSEEVVLWP